MRIAFLGLGNMGFHMAAHLLRAGHELRVWNRTPAKAERLVSAGATIAGSPYEAGGGVEAAITMLADDAAVIASVLQPGGLIESLPQGALHISMSTISVALSKRLAEEHAQRKQHYVAAPVFGRPEAAEAGKLFVVAAGHTESVDKAKPLLEGLSQRVFVFGQQPEMANAVKLSGNFLIASVIESLGEAIALTRKYGIDPHEYVDFLTNTLFAAPVYKTYGGLIADEKYEPAGFKMRLGLKDIKLAISAAEDVDVALPFASVVHDHALTAIARGMADLDWSAIARLAVENAGFR